LASSSPRWFFILNDMMTNDEKIERDLQSLSIHEAAHAIVADEFDLFHGAFIAGRNYGATVHGRTDAQKTGAISFAGVMGEDICSLRSSERAFPKVVLTSETILDYTEQIRHSELSDSDSQGIAACPCPIAAARETYSILVYRLADLKSFANLLADNFRERFYATVKRNDPAADKADNEAFFSAVRGMLAKQFAARRKDKDERRIISERFPVDARFTVWIRAARKFLAAMRKKGKSMMTEFEPYANANPAELSRIVIHARIPDGFPEQQDCGEILRRVAAREKRNRREAFLALRSVAAKGQP
jgi:hypothetical protein